MVFLYSNSKNKMFLKGGRKMTRRYLITGMFNSGINMINNQGFSAPKFPGFFMLKNESDSPTSKKVIFS
jgi:hypothetical protein